MNPRGTAVYVLNGAGQVTAVRTSTSKPAWTARISDSPDNLAVAPAGRTLYVLSAPSASKPGFVTPVSAAGTPGRRIAVGPDPLAAAFTPGGGTLYVTCSPEKLVGGTITFGPGQVVPVATTSGRPRPAIKVGAAPVAITIAP